MPPASSSSAAAQEADDGSCLRRIARGDQDAFRAFYQRYAGRVHGLLNHLCRDAVLAEDLLQEVFLAVWRRAETYSEDRGAASSWVFAITRNKVLDHRRRAKGKPSPAEPELEALPEPARGNRDLRISLYQAMAALKTEQRAAVQLAYFGGYTYEETAARLQVPLGTLKSRIRVGLRTLRTRLEEAAVS